MFFSCQSSRDAKLAASGEECEFDADFSPHLVKSQAALSGGSGWNTVFCMPRSNASHPVAQATATLLVKLGNGILRRTAAKNNLSCALGRTIERKRDFFVACCLYPEVQLARRSR